MSDHSRSRSHAMAVGLACLFVGLSGSATATPAATWSSPTTAEATYSLYDLSDDTSANVVASGAIGRDYGSAMSIDRGTGEVAWMRTAPARSTWLATPDGGAWAISEFAPYLLARIAPDGSIAATRIVDPALLLGLHPSGDLYLLYPDSLLDAKARVARIRREDANTTWAFEFLARDVGSSTTQTATVWPDGTIALLRAKGNPFRCNVELSRYADDGTPLPMQAVVGGGCSKDVSASAALGDGTTFSIATAGPECRVFEFSLVDGSPLRDFGLAGKPSCPAGGTTILPDGSVAISSTGFALYDAGTGALRWQSPSLTGQPIVSGNALYALSPVGGLKLTRVDLATGASTWAKSWYRYGGWYDASPGPNGSLIVSGQQPAKDDPARIERIDANGGLAWSIVAPQGPTHVDSLVFLGVGEVPYLGYLYEDDHQPDLPAVSGVDRLDVATGNRVWERRRAVGGTGDAALHLRAHPESGLLASANFHFDAAVPSHPRNSAFLTRYDADGSEIWNAGGAAVGYYSVVELPGSVVIDVAQANGVNRIEGRNPATGAVAWSVDRMNGGEQVFTFGGAAFVLGRWVNELQRLNPATGGVTWTRTIAASALGPVDGDATSVYLPIATGETALSLQAIAISDGAVQWTVEIAPAAGTQYVRTAVIGEAIYVAAQKHLPESGVRLVKLERATGAIGWSVDLPLTSAGTVFSLLASLHEAPNGELVLFRDAKPAAGYQQRTSTLVTRVSPANGAVLGNHVIASSRDQNAFAPGRRAPFRAASTFAGNAMYGVVDTTVQNVVSTEAVESIEWPAAFGLGDASVSNGVGYVDDRTIRIDSTIRYEGDALPEPLHVDVLPNLATDAFDWTCTIVGTGTCTPQSGAGAARIEVVLANGARAEVRSVARRLPPFDAYAGATIRATLPFALEDIDPSNDEATSAASAPLLSDSFEATF